MRVISEKAIRDFCKDHPSATAPFRNWVLAACETEWRNWASLKATFSSADIYNGCVIFDIAGNNYRLIARVRYSHKLKDGRWSLGRIYVRHVLTHAEYGKDKWKADCT